MASVTRSSRQAEGHHPHHHNVNASGPLTRYGPGPSLFHAAAAGVGGRTKRALDVAECDFDTLNPKKTRIAVEIVSRPHAPLESADVYPSPIPRPAAVANSANRSAKPTPPVPSEQEHNLTKHQAKVINGIRHELDRLQPRPADTKEPGRKLRSQEATRFKSELSAYFPDYDEVIGNDPKEQHLLNPDTPIVVLDSKLSRAGQRPHHQTQTPSADFPIRGYGDALFVDVFDAQRIDFRFLEAQQKINNIQDPLPDSLFEPIHKRAERLERSIRNTEKGRAQHEKDQIVRLLEGLQGHDWLRVMGVSGVTETKKKQFEPARTHFIKGCQAILDKFRNWSLEEKRRKQRALAEKVEKEGDAGDGDGGGYSEGEDGPRRREDEDDDEDETEELAASSQDDTSEASSPAKQLRQEARVRLKLAAANSKKPRPGRRASPPMKPLEPPKEFKSFFSKKYERDGALNRHRRAGRKVLAWGHPIPDLSEADFELPEEYRDEETLKARARKKRRDRRDRKSK